MNSKVNRILALGIGAALDQAVASLSHEGFAVVELDDAMHGRRLLRNGNIDLVVADGESEAVTALLPKDGYNRPWIVLAHPDGSPVPKGRARVLELPVSTALLCREIRALIEKQPVSDKQPARRAGKAALAEGRIPL